MKAVIYTKHNCPYCVKAKVLLKLENIEYTEISIDDDVSRGVFLEQFPGVRTVPYIIIDDEKVGTYDNLVEYTNRR